MIENTKNLSEEIDINQKRLLLIPPHHRKTKLITNIFIYCSQNYPATKKLAADVIRSIADHHLASVF